MSTMASALAPDRTGEDILVEASKRRAAGVPSRFYRPELDVLRFFAFLAVFLHHGIYSFSPTFSKMGGFGLSLFFLLSAFLITELLQREKNSTGSIAIKEFYIRRSLRIWPLYFGFLAFVVVLGWFFPSHGTTLGFLLTFAFMVGNVYIGRFGFPTNPAGFLWSISIEEQFYVFWPWLNRRFGTKILRRIALGSFPLATLTICVLTAMHKTANIGVWTNSVVQFQFFGMGVLLALGLNGTVPVFSGFARVALAASGVGLWFLAASYSGMVDVGVGGVLGVNIGYYLVGLGCVALFLGAYGLDTSRVPASLIYLGKISYGLYVFHQFTLECAGWLLNRFPATASNTHHAVFGAGHLVLGFLLTILMAVLSYRNFETPFLKLKERFAVIRTRTV